MRKTTVYLSEEEVEGLRRLAAERGEGQAALIREGVRRLLRDGSERKFRSMGVGEGDGEPRPRWNADTLRDGTLGRR